MAAFVRARPGEQRPRADAGRVVQAAEGKNYRGLLRDRSRGAASAWSLALRAVDRARLGGAQLGGAGPRRSRESSNVKAAATKLPQRVHLTPSLLLRSQPRWRDLQVASSSISRPTTGRRRARARRGKPLFRRAGSYSVRPDGPAAPAGPLAGPRRGLQHQRLPFSLSPSTIGIENSLSRRADFVQRSFLQRRGTRRHPYTQHRIAARLRAAPGCNKNSDGAA